jgi:hypothetical protein
LFLEIRTPSWRGGEADEAIQGKRFKLKHPLLDCFAALAMTSARISRAPSASAQSNRRSSPPASFTAVIRACGSIGNVTTEISHKSTA